MQIAVLGIDLVMNSCSVVGLDSSGAVTKRRWMRPENIGDFTQRLPTCIVAMETCCGAHYLESLIASQYHDPQGRHKCNDSRPNRENIAQSADMPFARGQASGVVRIRLVGLRLLTTSWCSGLGSTRPLVVWRLFLADVLNATALVAAINDDLTLRVGATWPHGLDWGVTADHHAR